LIKILFLFLITFLFGCQTSNLFEDVKKDFAVEKKVTVFDRSNINRQFQIPLNGMILVNKDDTIYSIANKYKVVPKDIIDDNNLVEPYNLKVNQILFLRNKNLYVIRFGDNLEKISLKFAVNKSDIIRINKLSKPYQLKVGNKILIPQTKDFSVVDLIIDKKIYKSEPKISNKNRIINAKSLNSPKFIWPSKGQIIKNFGVFGKGQHYDGVDIKASNNSPIYSIYEGTIAFTGSEIKKFGNLILIKHKNGWLSAYSNVGKFNVKQGSSIKKGELIAYSSNDLDYYHFQLRHNRNPVNPIEFLN
jgi:murein DD-endopeptidase MepM/ murein hydrolase activator NlpD